MIYDVIVIGGGTAGMTAALYVRRAGKSVLIIEAEGFGGQITYSPRVENYPGIQQISGNEFADQLLEQVLSLGAEVELEKVTAVRANGDIKYVITDCREYECRSLIIATGVKHRKLGLLREDELAGNGVSYCAVCDGAFFKNKKVAVAGGGNTALQSALFLSAYCNEVSIIHRRTSFRGEDRLSNQVKTKNNIKLFMNSNVSALYGNDNLEGIEIVNNDNAKSFRLDIDGLFVAIGQVPDNILYSDIVDLDEAGYILSGEDCRTKTDGVFAAGDCRRKDVRQLTTAVADGAVAALAACLYVDLL